jgi:hypothetical protein
MVLNSWVRTKFATGTDLLDDVGGHGLRAHSQNPTRFPDSLRAVVDSVNTRTRSRYQEISNG